MRVTRQFWGSCAVVATLAVLAVVLAAPVLLVGAAALAAWLLTEQYRFVRRLEQAADGLALEQSLAQSAVAVESTTPVEINVERAQTHLDMTITPTVPTGARGEAPTITMGGDRQQAAATFDLEWPLAGGFELQPPTVTFRDGRGLFEESLRLGETQQLTVEPRAPRNLQVGSGGEEIAATYGSHSARRGGTGIDPAELRQYLPGDPSNQIDWKATARLRDTYVREYEAQTDRETILIADQRAPLAVGEPGQRKFDYLREVLLSMTDMADRLDDPLGLLAVDEGGTTLRLEASLARHHHRKIRTRLHDLEPTPEGARPTARAPTPGSLRQVGGRLQGEQTAFSETLRPYFASLQPHVDRVTDEPLFGAVNRVTGTDATRLLLIATDDSHPAELREAVKLASRRGHQVVVFLTPQALFEAYALADLEATYDAYVAFEEFRRELDRAPRTRAFEVGPGDRIDAIVNAGRHRRARGVANE